MDPDGFLAGPASPTLPLVEVLPVRVLSRLFRGLCVQGLKKAHADGRLQFFNNHQALADQAAFNAYLRPLYKTNWTVFAKELFAGSKAVLAYLSRYTHRVAISNRRLISADDRTVTFKWKDDRVEGADRYRTMTLPVDEFIRRFLIYVFPKRFHRIRHYGLLCNGNRAENVKRAGQLLSVPENDPSPNVDNGKTQDEINTSEPSCPACGGRMRMIETFEPGSTPTSHHQHAPPDTREGQHDQLDHTTPPAQARRSPVNNRLWLNTPQLHRLPTETTTQGDQQPAPSPPKTHRERGDDPHPVVRSAAGNSDKSRQKHQFPIDLSKLHRSSKPRFPTLALLRRLSPKKLGCTCMIGVRETFTTAAQRKLFPARNLH